MALVSSLRGSARLSSSLRHRWTQIPCCSIVPACFSTNKDESPSESDPAIFAKQSTFKRLGSLYLTEKRLAAVSMGALTLSSAITMCVPLGMGRVIDAVQAGSSDDLGMLVAGLGTVFVVGSGVNVARVATTAILGERITTHIRSSTFAHLMAHDMAFFDSNKTGDLLSRLSSDTSVVGSALSSSLTQALRSAFQTAGGTALMFVTCPSLATYLLLLLPPSAVVARLAGQRLKKMANDIQRALGVATDLAEERLSLVRTVMAFGQQRAEAAHFDRKVQDILDLATRRAWLNGSFFGAVDLGVKVGILAAMYYGVKTVADGTISGGDLTAFLMYATYVGTGAAGLTASYTDIMRGAGAAERVFQLMDQPAAIPLSSQQHGKTLPTVQGCIEFQDVSFAYPSRPDSHILQGLNLTVAPGSTVAVVGNSGCGKSTLSYLLSRLYSVTAQGGSVRLDGTDLRELDASWLRRTVAVVPQEPALFASTIAENIAYGLPEVDMGEVERAAREANAHAFISALPEGYDTYVGEKGTALSGGQKQRIAIARALIRDPSVLVLDEPMSALDAESEALVSQAILRARAGRTVLLITHNLLSLRAADQIVLLHHGQVAEQGSYSQLVALDGRFANLLRSGNLQQHH